MTVNVKYLSKQYTASPNSRGMAPGQAHSTMGIEQQEIYVNNTMIMKHSDVISLCLGHHAHLRAYKSVIY